MDDLILNKAVERINELQGIECLVMDREIRIEHNIVDAKIELRFGQETLAYNAEVKAQVVPANVPFIIKRMERFKPYIILAEYITTNAMELLKNKNIPYADTQGNMFIQSKMIYIYVQTAKTKRTKLRTTNRAFTKAGLKVVYQFLLHPEYLNRPYRFIGEKADVTIDTVGKVIKGLLKDRYIYQETNQHYEYTDRKKLFETWTTEFNKTLRPKLNKRNYTWVDKGRNWKELNLPKGTYWGGAAAAEKLTDYLIANKFIIYTGPMFRDLIKDLRIVPEKDGQIEVIEKFWVNEAENDFVNPILIYTDLVNTIDPRYLETANLIFDEYIQNKL